MKINDKNGKLIAIILNFNDANDYKNFYTDNEADMQFGVLSCLKMKKYIIKSPISTKNY